MEKKEFSKFEIASIKRTAANVWPLLKKKHNLAKQMNDLCNKIEDTNSKIMAYNAPIKALTGGYNVEDLIERIVGDNKIAKYQLKYPETVVPIEDTEVMEDCDFIEYPETEINGNVLGCSVVDDNLE